MLKELPKVYEPQQVETEIYKMWEDGKYFRPQGKEGAGSQRFWICSTIFP